MPPLGSQDLVRRAIVCVELVAMLLQVLGQPMTQPHRGSGGSELVATIEHMFENAIPGNRLSCRHEGALDRLSAVAVRLFLHVPRVLTCWSELGEVSADAAFSS